MQSSTLEYRDTRLYAAALKELENTLARCRPEFSQLVCQNYFAGKGNKLDTRMLALRSATLERIRHAPIKINQFPLEEAAQAWHFCFMQSQIFEVLTLALQFFGASALQQDASKYFSLHKLQAKRVDNWVHSDLLSKLVANCLEQNPGAVWPVLEDWNSSSNPWLIRQSLVGTFYYAKQRKKHPPVDRVLLFIEPHLSAPHYYLQKGLGWTLRESFNVYPDQTLAFLNKHLEKISATAWTAAAEKIPIIIKKKMNEKRSYLRSRKLERKK